MKMCCGPVSRMIKHLQDGRTADHAWAFLNVGSCNCPGHVPLKPPWLWTPQLQHGDGCVMLHLTPEPPMREGQWQSRCPSSLSASSTEPELMALLDEGPRPPPDSQRGFCSLPGQESLRYGFWVQQSQSLPPPPSQLSFWSKWLRAKGGSQERALPLGVVSGWRGLLTSGWSRHSFFE